MEWLIDELGDSVIYAEGMDAGHMSFIIGEDMTYFKETAMDLIKQYQS